MIQVNRWWKQSAILLLVCTVAGCGSDSREDVRAPLQTERSERGDTTVVRTVHGSVWGDSMSLVADLSIGELDGDDPYILGSIRGIEVDSEGRIFVVDRQAREVRVFSADGEHLRTIGRAGDGPGEFRTPDHVRLTRDGRIVVRDAPARFSVFSRDGEYLDGWLLRAGFSTSAPFYLDAHDRVLNPSLSGRLVWYDLDGTSGDTVPVPTLGYESPRLRVEAGGGVASYSIPFTPSESWAMTREGSILFGMNERYVLERTDTDGTVLRIEREVEPVPVSTDEALWARERLLQAIRSNAPDWRWEGPEIPAHKPAYGSVIPGMDGTIWVMRRTPGIEEANPDYDPRQQGSGSARMWREEVIADVFDAEGLYLGPVRFPAELTFLAQPIVSADFVIGAVTHSDGYPQVIRYRLVPGGRL